MLGVGGGDSSSGHFTCGELTLRLDSNVYDSSARADNVGGLVGYGEYGEHVRDWAGHVSHVSRVAGTRGVIEEDK